MGINGDRLNLRNAVSTAAVAVPAIVTHQVFSPAWYVLQKKLQPSGSRHDLTNLPGAKLDANRRPKGKPHGCGESKLRFKVAWCLGR